jgi:hypothetical protein
MIMLSGRERDTILAALRLWQHALDGDVVLTGEGSLQELVDEIASDSGAPLSPNEIDSLCERLNR